jgi:hypothetical protein
MDMVFAYYLAPGAKEAERYRMYNIDFLEAKGRHPDQWSLEAPDVKIIDKVPVELEILPQGPANLPPVVEMAQARKVRSVQPGKATW